MFTKIVLVYFGMAFATGFVFFHRGMATMRRFSLKWHEQIHPGDVATLLWTAPMVGLFWPIVIPMYVYGVWADNKGS